VADPDAVLPRPGLSVGDIDLQQIPPSMRTGTFQLPPDIDDFIGRHEVLRRLQDLLAPSDRGAPAVVVSAAAGQAGVERALGLMRAEIERGMKLMGCTAIGQLTRENLRFR